MGAAISEFERGGRVFDVPTQIKLSAKLDGLDQIKRAVEKVGLGSKTHLKR